LVLCAKTTVDPQLKIVNTMSILTNVFITNDIIG